MHEKALAIAKNGIVVNTADHIHDHKLLSTNKYRISQNPFLEQNDALTATDQNRIMSMLFDESAMAAFTWRRRVDLLEVRFSSASIVNTIADGLQEGGFMCNLATFGPSECSISYAPYSENQRYLFSD